MRAYLESKHFAAWGLSNYIDLGQVQAREVTLQSNLNVLVFTRVHLDKPVSKYLFLDEERAELQDDNINMMGLSEPKRLNYLNFAKE